MNQHLPTKRTPSVHFSSQTDDWSTPQWLFDSISREFLFTLDPCASRENAKCRQYFTKQEDGLMLSWEGETVFMNPPYGRIIGRWIRKAHEEARRGATVVCLVPARTDTEWFHRYCVSAEVRFLRGRLKFGSAKSSAPFPSAIIIFRSRMRRILPVHYRNNKNGTTTSEKDVQFRTELN